MCVCLSFREDISVLVRRSADHLRRRGGPGEAGAHGEDRSVPQGLLEPQVPNMEALLGKGLVLTNGEDWKRHRKVVHPAFNLDKLKVCLTSDQAYLIHCIYKYNVIINYSCIMIYIVLSLG